METDYPTNHHLEAGKMARVLYSIRMKMILATLGVLLSVTLFTPAVTMGAEKAAANDQQYVVGVSGVV